MSRELAKWMRTAGIAITNEIVNLREEGIDNFLKKKMTKEDAKEITKLYFTGKCNEDFFESLVDTFYEVDNTFSDDMKQEITVLAGIIIFEMIERGKSKDIIELIEMYAQTYLFLGYSSVVDDISIMLQKDLENRMLALREDLSFENKSPINGLGKEFCFSIKEDEMEEYNSAVIEKLDIVVKKVNELSNQLNSINKITLHHESIIYEDLQLLWWLMTECSDDKETRYLNIEPHFAAILAGKDLAQRVSVFPGPYSAKALLRKVLEFSEKEPESSLEKYIDSVDDDIIMSLLEKNDIEIHTPILFALKKKMENGENCWRQAFNKEYCLKKESFLAVEVAYEMYIECLICNVLH